MNPAGHLSGVYISSQTARFLLGSSIYRHVPAQPSGTRDCLVDVLSGPTRIRLSFYPYRTRGLFVDERTNTRVLLFDGLSVLQIRGGVVKSQRQSVGHEASNDVVFEKTG